MAVVCVFEGWLGVLGVVVGRTWVGEAAVTTRRADVGVDGGIATDEVVDTIAVDAATDDVDVSVRKLAHSPLLRSIAILTSRYQRHSSRLTITTKHLQCRA
jgi:hypothetical protein